MGVSQKQLKILWGKAGARCSFTNCNKDLIIEEEGGNSTIIGYTAHIRSEKVNGPRYDPNYEKSELNKYKNLIVLCHEHHKLVDENPEDYPAEILEEMKEEHEEKIRDYRIDKAKKIYSSVWTESKEFSSVEVLGLDRGSKEYSFSDYYYKREIDNKFKDLVENTNKNIILIGRPLSGKTRLVFEWFKEAENIRVLIPNKTNLNEEIFIPKAYDQKAKKIAFFDDLNDYTNLVNIHNLFFQLLLEKDIRIIATCQSDVIFNIVKLYFFEKLKINIKNIFSIINIDNISELDLFYIINKVDKKIDDISFDGTIGSIFLPLQEMEKRYEECTNNEKLVLKSIKISYLTGILIRYSFSKIEWIKKLIVKYFESKITSDEIKTTIKSLINKNFLRRLDKIYHIESAYLTNIIEKDKVIPSPKDYEIIADIFSNKKEFQIRIGLHILYTINIQPNADLIKLRISVLERSLEQNQSKYTHDEIRFSIGSAYGKLGELENTEDNCSKSIKILSDLLKDIKIDKNPLDYASILISLGVNYWNLSIVKDTNKNAKKAIESYQKILDMFSDSHPIPFHPAGILSNMGLAYMSLAGTEDPKDMYQKSISCYKSAIEIIAFDTNPEEYGLLYFNLGEVYNHLSRIENSKDNLIKGINSIKETFKVYNKENYPNDYALSNLVLGKLYRSLAKEEQIIENNQLSLNYLREAIEYYKTTNNQLQYTECLIAVASTLTSIYAYSNDEKYFNASKEALDESLILYRKNNSRIYIGLTLNNIGVLYTIKAGNNNDIISIRIAIQNIKRSLEYRTKKIVPFDYAETNLNLGNSYIELAKLQNKTKNLKKAIKHYEISQEIFTLSNSPIAFGKIKQRLGLCYSLLAEISDKNEKSKFCQIAKKEFELGLKILNSHSKKLCEFINEDLEKLKRICN